MRPPVWFRLIAVLALLWNLAGVGAFAMQASMGAETVAALPPAQRDLWFGMPGWAWVAYGLAVAAGTLGAVGLLLRRGWALPAFVVGLATVVVQFTYPFLMTDALSVMGPGMAVLPLAIVVIAVAEVLAARAWRGRGWLH
ncbi:sugar transporter [Roseomonas eburnea]|uniref:Sugar transporter n=1 Tax=Neoroseomonas eburnea TaxID=1346889 RepID=A0A9X9XJT1_9PROT|nr:sugar transporter [Neoroseomonas eburnea]